MVIVPVWQEVEHHRSQALHHAEVYLTRQRALYFSPHVDALYTLHAGEQEALHLCLEFKNSLLLTDDTAARLAAKKLGVAAHGTLGTWVRAIRQQNPLKIGRVGIVTRYSNTNHFAYSRFFVGRSH